MRLCFVFLIGSLVLLEICLLSEGLPDKTAKIEEINPDEIITIDGHDYFISENPPLTVVEAIRACNERGMALLSLQTLEKSRLIKAALNATYSGRSFWTSGMKFMDSWLWSSTGELFTEVDWIAGNPDYPGPEMEVCVWFTPSWAWRDDPCSLKIAYICE